MEIRWVLRGGRVVSRLSSRNMHLDNLGTGVKIPLENCYPYAK
jgi:hypothetical protein